MSDILHAHESSPLSGGPSFSLSNRCIRLLWQFTWWSLASWTPSQLHPWRRTLLRIFGAQMGKRADVRGSARVWLPSNLTMADHALIGPDVICYSQAAIFIGERALISQRAHLCAGSHDIDDQAFQLIARPIVIGKFAWIATEAFVGPGSVVEEGAVLGARGVSFGHLEEWTVYVGNPATALRKRTNVVMGANR